MRVWALVAVALVALAVVVLVAVTHNPGGGVRAGATASSTSTTPAAPTATPTTPGAGARASTSTAVNTSSKYVVILGSLGCPHCRRLKDFFEEEMKGVAFFCSVDKRDSTCIKAFSVLFTAGVTRGVPTSIVCDNNTRRVLAIVVGELEDADAWTSIMGNGYANETAVPVYIGGKLSGYLKVKSQAGMGDLYSILCVETLKDSTKLG